MLADVDHIPGERSTGHHADFSNASLVDCRHWLYPTELIGPRPIVNMHHASVVTACRKRDRGQRSNDALIRTTQPLEMTSGPIGNRPGVGLGDDLSLGSSREHRDLL